jgi:nucleoside-diphosphate-sugar epimerase
MRILILGAAGMLGRKLSAALANKGALRGRAISHLSLADVVMPDRISLAGSLETVVADLTDPGRA